MRVNSPTLDDLSNDSGIYKATLTIPNSSNSLNSLNPSNSQSSQNSLDSLPLDNTAFAVFQSSASRRVLLVSKGNLFLEQLLASLPGIQPFRALPATDGTIQMPNDPFDLYIFDGILPPELPNANLLFINPSSNPFRIQEYASDGTRAHRLRGLEQCSHLASETYQNSRMG